MGALLADDADHVEPVAADSYTSRCEGVSVSRTNIDIHDEVMRRVQAGYGLRTKREAVDFALRRLLRR